MLRIFCVVAIAAAFASCAYPQRVEQGSPLKCDYSELYKKEGWTIPGVDGAQKKWRAPIQEKAGVYRTELQPSRRAAKMQSFLCSREHVGRMEIEDRDIGVLGLSSFDFGGHIFAYDLIYGVDGIGAEWFVRFYDLDGSGRFALRRSETNRLVPDLIPDWVKR